METSAPTAAAAPSVAAGRAETMGGERKGREITHSSDDSRIPCSTDLSARPAVAATHMMKPKRWKFGSPCIVQYLLRVSGIPIPIPIPIWRRNCSPVGSGSALIAAALNPTHPGGDDDAGDDGDEGGVGGASLAASRDGVGEEGGEEGRGGADGLVERYGEVAERDVPRDDGGTEDGAEDGDAGELRPGPGGGAASGGGGGAVVVGERGEEGAGGHVAGGEQDWEAEAVDGEEVLVEQEDPDVGGVP